MSTLATYINMPRLGLTMTEGTIVKWLKKEGDRIEKDEEIVEIESDKSIVPHKSPQGGYLLKILVGEGDACEIYKPIAILGEQGESIDELMAEGGSNDKPVEKFADEASKKKCEDKLATAETCKGTGRIFISPAARRIARENNVNISDIPFPAGKKRIEKADVLSYIQVNRVKMAPLAAKIAAEKNIDVSSLDVAAGKSIYSSDLEADKGKAESVASRVPVIGIRKVVAARMKDSINTAAHVSLTTEVDMSSAIDLRNRIKDRVSDKHGVKVSINDIVIKCVAVALKEHPRINSVFTESEIIEKDEVNVGVAVALEEGIMVPVIRNTNKLSIGEIAAESKRLAGKARQGALLPDEYSGGTFTVSNLGMFGITQFTSIINQPESAILSVAKVVERAVVENGQIVIRPMANLTINFDHRPIDGSTAARFLARVKNLLEEPYELIV